MNTLAINQHYKPNTCNPSQIEKKLQIHLDSNLNFIEVKGSSIAGTIFSQYDRLVKNINQFLETRDNLTISFKYEMFNTSTIKYLLSIIKMMNKAHKRGKSVKIYWKVDTDCDDEMTEAALDLSMMCKFDFQIITESSTIDTKSVEDEQVIKHRKLLFRLPRTSSRLAA